MVHGLQQQFKLLKAWHQEHKADARFLGVLIFSVSTMKTYLKPREQRHSVWYPVSYTDHTAQKCLSESQSTSKTQLSCREINFSSQRDSQAPYTNSPPCQQHLPSPGSLC